MCFYSYQDQWPDAHQCQTIHLKLIKFASFTIDQAVEYQNNLSSSDSDGSLHDNRMCMIDIIALFQLILKILRRCVVGS